MKLSCSAVISREEERKTILKNIMRTLTPSYSELGETLNVYYEGDDRTVVDTLIQIFARYEDHKITFYA